MGGALEQYGGCRLVNTASVVEARALGPCGGALTEADVSVNVQRATPHT